MISLFVEYMYKIMSKYYQQNLEAEMKDFAISGLLIRMSIGTYFIEHENFNSLFSVIFCFAKNRPGKVDIKLSAKLSVRSFGFPRRVSDGNRSNLLLDKVSFVRLGKKSRNRDNSSPSVSSLLAKDKLCIASRGTLLTSPLADLKRMKPPIFKSEISGARELRFKFAQLT